MIIGIYENNILYYVAVNYNVLEFMHHNML